MSALKTHFELLQQPNTTILTPNRRLSATLHKHFQTQQLNTQQQCWDTPDILPVNSWIERLWYEYTSKTFCTHPLLLNNTHEQFLWEKILSANSNKPLLRLAETAELIQSAWRLLNEWQVKIDGLLFQTTEDYAALYQWLIEYQQICREKNYIDRTVLPNLLIAKIKDNIITPPQHIILIGFNEISPQLQTLLDTCKNKGSEWRNSNLTHSQHNNNHRISLRDQEQEIMRMAAWAKSIYSANQNAAIGCVLPSLDKIRDRTAQIFSEVFADEMAQNQQPFNISAGKSLLQYPIINTALQLLTLIKNTISVETFCYLLASPFIGGAERERIKRANVDKLLRKKNIKQLTFGNETPVFTGITEEFAERINQALNLLDKNKILSFSEWANLFNQFLTQLGWPGERSLISEEYQTVENWLKLFEEFASLDQIATPVSFYEAFQALHKITQSRVFQPKTPDAPIQVLGMLEAASLPFDFLWVAGLDDAAWPPQPKPNPFIPKRLQRELGMPHSTAERELIYCRELTQQFMQSANEVIFSHAEKKEELTLSVSPLIRHLPQADLENIPLHLTLSERIYHSKSIEKIHDEQAPNILETETIRGGMSVIKHQALCPFKSFAEWRLHAHELESCMPGLRAKDRGTLLHQTLEIIWNELKNHQSLVHLSGPALSTLINTAIDKALIKFSDSYQTQQKYIELEKMRLHKLVRDWLALEKERPPFKVLSSEKAAEILLNQLKLALRIDRIDELADGSKLIIDYKTGKNNNVNDWFNDRLSEPQLPLYAALDPSNTGAIAFAQIAPGEICFKGISRDDLEIKGIKAISEKRGANTWDEQLAKWNEILTKLSDDFYQGIAKVDPKEHETCNWCALQSFCRINETSN